jgi:hypothetical protein
MTAEITTNIKEAEQSKIRMYELEDELKALSVRLDFLVEQFRMLVPGVAATWIRQEFGRGIKDNAEQIQELGVSGVKIIKDDMERVIHALPTVCGELLHNRSAWAHYSDESLAPPSVHKEFFLDRIFRDLISTAGPVLEQHNLLGNRATHSYWQRVKEGWRYGMNPSIDPVAPEISEEYMKGLDRLRKIKLQHASEKKGLAEVRAQTLWDSV